MKTVFDLPSSKEDLSSMNQGMINYNYDQVTCKRNVTDTDSVPNQFAQGQQVYEFEGAAQEWWFPNRSYLKFRCELSRADGSMLRIEDDIAPAMNMASNFYQNAEFQMSEKTVCSITSDLPQIDTLVQRMKKTNSWLQSIGQSSNFMSGSFHERQKHLCLNGYMESENLVSIGSVSPIVDGTSLNGILTTGLIAANTMAYTAPAGGLPAFLTINHTDTSTAVGSVSDSATTLMPLIGAGDYIAIKGLTIANPVGAWANIATTDGQWYITRVRSVRKRIGEVTLVLANATASPNSLIIELEDSISPADQAAAALNGAPWTSVSIAVYRPRRILNRQVNSFEIIWVPPLSLFTSIQHAVPMCGKQRLLLQPFSRYREKSIESLLSNNKVLGTDYRFRITEAYFMVCKAVANPVVDKEFFLDLNEVQVTVKDLQQSNTLAKINTNASMTSSTYGITLAFQAVSVGDPAQTAHSPTRFRIVNTANIDRLRTPTDDVWNLTQYYIKYAGQTIPDPQPDLDLTGQTGASGVGPAAGGYLAPGTEEDQRDWMVERYWQNLENTGAIYDSDYETIQQWRERGMYFYHPFLKSNSDKSSDAIIYAQFQQADPNTNVAGVTQTAINQAARVLVFYHYKRICAVKIVNSRIADISTYDV